MTARLRRAGFVDTEQAAGLLTSTALAEVCPAAVDGSAPADELLVELGRVADPDLALRQLVRLVEATAGGGFQGALRTVLADSPVAGPPTQDESIASAPARLRLFALLGGSITLGDDMVRRPELIKVLTTGQWDAPAAEVRADLLRAVGADPDAAVPVAVGDRSRLDMAEMVNRLRRAYRDQLVRIAAADLTVADPLSQMPTVGASLADLAAAAVEAALAIARAELDDDGRGVRLAVIGMGKCGGRELNYVSDVDVIYVVEPAEGSDEGYATTVGAKLAGSMARVCSGTFAEPPLWPLDAALRPEGKQGPLVRTLASHLAYYDRWAKTWEFQALLKARAIAGDRALGRAYEEAIAPLVWSAVNRENFVEDSQAMRRRVEEHVPPTEADRQLKLGRGGLRDVEFTVQLLQLVHGRADESIRCRSTLTSLRELAAGGYVGREHAARLAVCYRFLRVLEHRIQLYRLRRTHLMPTGSEDLRRLARSIGLRVDGAEALQERWRATRREVRELHEALFYRPLLPATAQLSGADVSLAPEAAKERFAAIGYRDPAGALRHVVALTEGVSRRAAIQRQLLPVMLGWFAEGASPDAGLLAFRTLSEGLGSTHWYLKLLRDSGTAADRLAHILANSRYAADALARSPESITWLDDDADLAPRGAERLASETDAVLTRAEDYVRATVSLRAIRRRELARTAVAELLGVVDSVQAAGAISDAADLVLVGGLRIARRAVKEDLGLDPLAPGPAKLLVVAMGRLGGAEMGYGSDADVLFVHQSSAGASAENAQSYALAVASRLRSLLSAVGTEPGLAVDADLRPEGRNGPLVRSLDSYAEYYGRWASVWECQALLRARPVAGDVDGLGQRFVALIDPLRYPERLEPAAIREVRRIKARVEAERLPRGVDPARHLKLGRGAVADVEWTAQLLQLQHAHAVPQMRTTATLAALRAATDAGVIDSADAEVLAEAWTLGSRLRSALVLWSGRNGGAMADVLPHDHQALTAMAKVLGLPGVQTGAELEELYLRTSRRARGVMERVFYG